jgi:hypothetical protein
MLIQIMTVDRSKRPEHELQTLARRLEARGHEVIVRRFAAARSYAGRSADVGEIVAAIWESDRACFEYAHRRQAPYTLILEDDCELDGLEGIDTAESFIVAHPEQVDLFFLGASPNCWWTATGDERVVRYSHAYWWHAVVFTTTFIDRHAGPRTWTTANDIHFSALIRSGDVRAYGLRRQMAFQADRRNRIAETLLYRCPWGDGRRIAALALVAWMLWFSFGAG